MKARKLILRKEPVLRTDEAFTYVYLPYNWIWKIYDEQHLMYRSDLYHNYWILDNNFISTKNMRIMGWESVNQEEAKKLYPNLTF
jgi:hypothetical protein